jgi:hypothetical protein
MKTSIVVLTPDRELSRTVTIRKESLIPSDLRKRYPKLTVLTFPIQQTTSIDDLASFFAAHKNDGVIVVCDNRAALFVRYLGTPLFTVIFDHTFGGMNLQNYFQMILSKTIKAFAAFWTRFEDGALRKLLILPLRNFSADELGALRGLFVNGVNANGNFNNHLDDLLGELRQRQRPKRQRHYKTTYLVDDAGKHFQYGHEIHCRLETTVPPHNRLCAVSGIYRFGKRYDSERHFNVSRDGEDIQGVFHDCHGASAERGPVSHVNIFPNDFFGAN